MLVNAYGTIDGPVIRCVYITEKPVQNKDNLRKAREYLEDIVLKETIEQYKILGFRDFPKKGVLNGPWDPYWQQAKKETRKHFGYRLIADIPVNQVQEVNAWCIRWIDEHLKTAKS